MMPDEKITNSGELEFAVFCIENVAAKLGVGAERVYQAFTEKSNLLNGYIVPGYEILHTQSREYMHCMSDAYLAEELEQEYRQNNIIGVSSTGK